MSLTKQDRQDTLDALIVIRAEMQTWSFARLRAKARELGVPKYEQMDRDELIDVLAYALI